MLLINFFGWNFKDEEYLKLLEFIDEWNFYSNFTDDWFFFFLEGWNMIGVGKINRYWEEEALILIEFLASYFNFFCY
jgi:hypothetical protein